MSVGGGHGGGSHGGGVGDEDDMNEELKAKLKRGKDGVKRWDNRKYEFECPECNAHNPWGDGFQDQEEVNCHYCGCEFKVTFVESGKIKFRQV